MKEKFPSTLQWDQWFPSVFPKSASPNFISSCAFLFSMIIRRDILQNLFRKMDPVVAQNCSYNLFYNSFWKLLSLEIRAMHCGSYLLQAITRSHQHHGTGYNSIISGYFWLKKMFSFPFAFRAYITYICYTDLCFKLGSRAVVGGTDINMKYFPSSNFLF